MDLGVLRFGFDDMAYDDGVTATIYVLHVPLLIWISSEASRRFSEDRRNHTFETLLSTPLTARQIIQGQWLALFKQFAGPIALVLVWEIWMQIHNSHNRIPLWNQNEFVEYWPRTVLLVADAFALAWAGMGFGLKCKGRIRAILASLVLVLFVPWVMAQMIMVLRPFTVFTTLPQNALNSHFRTWQLMSEFVPSLLVDLLVIVWASSRLPQNFRQLALRPQRENPA